MSEPMCDMIYGTEDGLSMRRCGRIAVVQSVKRVSPLTATGHVRYCEQCRDMIQMWGVPVEPIPREGSNE